MKFAALGKLLGVIGVTFFLSGYALSHFTYTNDVTREQI